MKRSQDGKFSKMSKNDRFAQMTQQERLIEEKKREIQNKLEAKRRQNLEESKQRERQPKTTPPLALQSQGGPGENTSSSTSGPNLPFVNDGSFLEQFKQMKEKKPDSRSKSLNKYSDKNRWGNRTNSQSSAGVKLSRFSMEKQQITITTKTTFPSQTQATPVEPKIEQQTESVVPTQISSQNPEPPQVVTEVVTQQLNFQQSRSTLFQNPSQNINQPPLIFSPPPVPQFTVNQTQNPPQFNSPQSQIQPTPPNPSIVQQFNTLPPQINQIQQPIQVLNTSQEITVQQQLVAPQTQIFQPVQMQQAEVQQLQLQAISGSEGQLSLIQQPLGNQQVILPQTQLMNIVLTSQPSVLVSASNSVQLATVTLPTSVQLTGQTVELANIPPPNPIQVQNIPQPEPLNTMNIPPPAPLQVQNIPTPTTLHMNQIPDPKPLDLLAIPTPNSGHDFIKNIPPPNKNVPPPAPGVQFLSTAQNLPPQEVVIHTIAPSVVQTSANLQIQGIQVPNSLQGQIQIPTSVQLPVPPPQGPIQPPNLMQGQLGVMEGAPNSIQGVNQPIQPPSSMPGPLPPPGPIQRGMVLHTPPPMLPPAQSPSPAPQNPPPNFPTRPGSAPIPSLMSQKVLPPPGMEMNLPPPPINRPGPPPGFEPIGGRMPPSMSVPPPGREADLDAGPDRNAVFPPGSKNFEAMASLARMVVDCGPSIEDVVKEKKNRDPDLWFLFHKDSAAYAQYQDLIDRYRREKDSTAMRPNDRDRPVYERDDRYEREPRDDRFNRERRFEREPVRDAIRFDRDGRFEREPMREERFDRDTRFEREPRDDMRFDRFDREPRDDMFDRDGRYDREQRDDRFDRDARFEREQRDDRFDRDARFEREQRDDIRFDRDASYEREQRDERFQRDISWMGDKDRRNSGNLVPEVKTEANEELYEPEMALQDDEDDNVEVKQEIKQESEDSTEAKNERKRKRRSRWGEKATEIPPLSVVPVVPGMVPVVIPTLSHMPPNSSTPMLSKVTRSDPGLMQYVLTNYGSTNLEEETWKKAEENYKIHLLYQDMMKKRAEVEKLAAQGKNKYEYDSDEDTEGGTWEHKLRQKEMQATDKWALELNKQAEGKHHIGDFLPPEELKRFMENSNAVKEGRQPNFSDYKEFKIKEDNVGFKMLQKLGWSEGQGLGQNNTGIVEPINKGAPRADTQGLGLYSEMATEGEDEYETYRKRMMLAYRFRPNPLNNPRRPYY